MWKKMKPIGRTCFWKHGEGGTRISIFCQANPLLFVFLVDLYNCESTPSRTQFVLCVGSGKVELASAVASLTKYGWWYTKIGEQMQVAEVFKVFFFQTADWRWMYLPDAVTYLCLSKFLYEMDKILRYDTIAHLLTLLEHCGLQRCNSILFPEGSMVMTINPLSITKRIL